jgi:hypothetical protein
VRTRQPRAGTAAVEPASQRAQAWNLEAGKLVCAALVLAIALLTLRIAALW